MNEIIKNINSKNIAMMDTSDGLGDALYKLSTINNINLEIEFDKIPHHSDLKKYLILKIIFLGWRRL
ncbi:MAG: hypothetical protein L6V95_00680 [Candidatus Melainabacteria bacterium]|nr:MAG: hypothetical protein L6V95_00680 [Candidatus Melainabacteria bacterium]